MTRSIYTLLSAVLVLAPAAGARAELRVSVVSATELRMGSGVQTDGRHLEVVSRDGYRLKMLVEPDPGEILNPSFDGVLHPVAPSAVRQSLDEMRRLGGIPLDVIIYCLPGLPEGVTGSFCVGREVFLSPTLAPARTDQIAATVVHEIGHALHHTRLGSTSSSGWRMYGELRGLDPRIHRASAAHRNRPTEIFAEDFRMLFGGPMANYSGTHENHDLAAPGQVGGLREFFEGVVEGAYARGKHLAQVSNHPNPFNPNTTITVQLRPEQVALGASVEIDVFDVRGRRVKSFPPQTASERILVNWDGSDDRGQTVASGRYAYRVRVAHETVVGSMLLVQ